jgi:hypothetical protein
VCADAWTRAAQRLIGELEAHAAGVGGGHAAGGGGAGAAAENTVVVLQCDLVAAQLAVAPSVTAETLLEYARIRAKFS